MNRYQTRTPRLAFATAAVALTAITVALGVVAPARLDSATPDTLLAARKAVASPVEVAIVPSSIEVIGIRGPNLAAIVPASYVKPRG